MVLPLMLRHRLKLNVIVDRRADDAGGVRQVNPRIDALIEAPPEVLHIPSAALTKPLAEVILISRWLRRSDADQLKTQRPPALLDFRRQLMPLAHGFRGICRM
jgi:hypothetical protein